MATTLGYANEKAWAAVGTLATGLPRIKERLLSAYMSQGVHMPSAGPGIPEDLRQMITEFKRAMSSQMPVGDEGSIAATVNAMTEDEAHDMAERLVEIAHRLRRAHDDFRGARSS